LGKFEHVHNWVLGGISKRKKLDYYLPKSKDRSTLKADDFLWKEGLTAHLNQLRGAKNAFDQILGLCSAGTLGNLHYKFQACVQCF
jgi:hypothetical protein